MSSVDRVSKNDTVSIAKYAVPKNTTKCDVPVHSDFKSSLEILGTIVSCRPNFPQFDLFILSALAYFEN